MKETFVKLTLGQRPITTWVFAANITYEFILGLDVMLAHDASLDLTHHLLRLGDEEVPLRHSEARQRPTPCMKGNSELAATRCDS